ncbi:DNA repair protein complementing XP-C cells homolog isoform X1 [Octopus sinensis]|uniref:DNA repair protein complementing XP-C cells homolog isoform X1 n=1 Tax=Octopus sinensis TaxID=2607531 RepID=A0A6P7TMR4_9MOLL|nr:DNA repair protein complementing XP-C cells homolog isoform X1 [Octopus sinensis]XP_036370815.1 DNA repair protein complementing XP-C cells homolog isoform X1 [Octopus sinensis]
MRSKAVKTGSESSTADEVKSDLLSSGSRTRPRSAQKNYYESGNSDDSSSDGDEEQQNWKPKIQRPFSKARRSEETDSFSSEDDFEPEAKKIKSKKLGQNRSGQKAKTKLRIPITNSNRTRRGKNKDDEKEEGSSEDEERKGMKMGFSYNSKSLLLSSEGSDSDVPEPNSSFLKRDALEKCKQDIVGRHEREQKQAEVGKEQDVKGSGENRAAEESKGNIKSSVFNEFLLGVKDVNVDKCGTESKAEVDEKNVTRLKTSEKVGEPSKGKSSTKKKDKKELAAGSKSKGPHHVKGGGNDDEGGSEVGGKKGKRTNQRKTNVKKKETVKAGDVKKKGAIDEDDIRAMLIKVEGNKHLREQNMAGTTEDSSDSAWEEVADDPTCASSSTRQPQESIEITLEHEEWMKRKKKKKKSYQEEWQAFLKRIINNFQRNLRIQTHKVHLICCLCHGMHLNRICNDPTVQALGLSLVTQVPPRHKLTLTNVKDVIINFSKTIEIHTRENPDGSSSHEDDFSCDAVMEALSLRRATSAKELVLMVAAMLRALGLKIRIVLSFHPIPMKDTKEKTKVKSQTSKKTSSAPDNSAKDAESNAESSAGVKQTESRKGKSKAPKTVKVKLEREPSEETTTKLRKCRPSRARKANISYKDADSDDSSDEIKPEVKKEPSRKPTQKAASENSGSSNSDFEEDTIEFRSAEKKKTSRKTKTVAKTTSHKLLSSSSSDNSLSVKHDLETWIEIYLEKENRWLSVDCVDHVFDDVGHFGKLSSQQLVYVIAFDNDGYLKDLTARYSDDFLVKTRKLRVDKEWWDETLKPYVNTSADDVKEDEQIKGQLLDQPLPKTIGEFKSHPLYALKRHLLKFEAIYPNSAVPLGFIRNEPIYARECVVQLHARETWMKEGRCVKIGEEPYKMVKSRPKWNKPKENPDIPDLEVFGFWQTEVYVPPPAVNGKIPRNEYGNVELYKPSMLPGGTVHLTEPGLNRVARKLGLDCAAAMVGWDFHGGSSHPVFDGWIVCVEHKEKVLAEWHKEQQLAKERETAKREKRIYGNWKKLIRGLRIREALKRKYDLQEPEDFEEIQAEETKDKNTQSVAKSTLVATVDDGDEEDDDDDDDDYQPKNRQKPSKRKSPATKTKASEEDEEMSPSAKKKKKSTAKTKAIKKKK